MAEVTCGSMEAREAGASCAVSAGLCGPHRTEECWLQAGCTFAERWLFTEGPSLAEDIQQFREGILRCLCRSGKQEEGRLGLPVSYSFVSVSELKSQQRSPCCSHLFWSTDQYNKWTRQGEALLHNQKALPRACLLLIGYLTDQASVEKARRVDGSLYVRDKSSAMPCEMLHFSLDLLDQLLLFPGWSYLPAQHSSGGYLEILAPPISISPKPERLISSEGQPINVLYPHAAVQLLHTRTEGRFPPVNVAGELCRYSSLLDLRGRIFFTLFLKCFSTDHCVPVLVQMRDVHFLQRPSPHFPLVVLCCCLQSVILIQEFSSLCSAHQPFYTSRNLFVSLLLKHHLGLPQYLWLVKTVKDLQDKFCPHFIKQHQLEASVGTIAHRITEEVLVPILRSLSPSEHRCRNVEEEIAVVEQHQCPLTKYSPLKGPCEVLSLSQLYADAERQGWERLCLPQLLPSSQAQYMNTQELNRSLAWSFLTLDAQDFQPQCILLGVLRSSSRSGSLQLQDESRSVPCLIIKRGRACCSHFTDTGFIGNMLLMERFQVVVERFIRSDFPSWRQLASPEYVREKRSRVYIQFYMEDAVNLGQSGAVSRLHQLPREVKLQSAPHEIPAEPVASKDQPSKRQAEPDPSFHVPLKAKVARVMEAGEATRTEHLGDAEATCAEHQGGGKSDEIGRQGSVSQLFLLVHKEGLLLRNCTPIQGDGTRDIGQQERLTLQLSFQATVVWVGKPRAEPGDTQESPEIIDGDWERLREPQRVLLLFTGKSIRWFPVLHPDCLYRLIIPRCSDVGVFKRLCAPTVPVKTQHLFNCPLLLVVPENWKLHYVTLLESLIEHQDLYQTLARGRPELHSVAEILQPKFTRSLVSFVGEIAERTLCEPERKSWIPTSLSKGRDEGVFLPWEYTLKLTVRDTSSSRSTLHVYINSSVPLLLGLLPKAQVHFYNLERKTSKLNNVYCKFVACSSFSVMELPSHPALRSAALDSESPPPDSSLPMMFLSQLMLQPEQSSRGRSVCHVVCVLSLGLNWLCSHCGSAFVNGSCSRTGPTCSSKTPVFQAYAKIIIEDGSTEAHVMCRNHQVSALLHLPPSEWEGLQQHVLKKGHVYIHHRGWSVEHKCTEAPDEDLLTKYLRKLCLSPLICRPVLLSFRPHQQGKEASHTDSVQTRTFGLGRYEYRTHIPAPLLLMCLELQEVDYKALCHLSSHRIRMAGLGLLPAPECSATRPP
ncbi:CST complex subunit CTC1 isoform X2 [Microcaecilia unicolor]|uniref:CST complex subunit CTC1 n=1 Tax=Microcaecilia unicolor TaxID=1415580 RepID=A0A6P7WZY7_9AMPH|nr:CST complex subunit CTC1 isoform X2 [Microcaecilia unicolor]